MQNLYISFKQFKENIYGFNLAMSYYGLFLLLSFSKYTASPFTLVLAICYSTHHT